MSEKMSTGFCNQLLGGTAVPGATLRAIVNGNFKLYIYGYTVGTGVLSVPSTADAAIGSNVLLCTVANATAAVNMAADPSVGVLAKLSSETWSGVNAATGTATFYRFQLPADVAAGNLLSAVYARVQGTIGVTSAFDMIVGTTALTSAATFTVNYFTQAIVPS